MTQIDTGMDIDTSRRVDTHADAHTDANAYQPSTSLGAKISRKLLPLQSRRNLRFKLERPIVSFTFDDFPRSALTNGASMLEAQNWHATFYVAAGMMGIENHHGKSFSEADLAIVQKNGHEIAGHTFSHLDCATSTPAQVTTEIARNNTALKALGLSAPIEHFAWPYGTATAGHKSALGTHFKSMRGVCSGVMHNRADLNCLKSTPLFSGEALEPAIKQVASLIQRPGWLIFFTHDVRDNPSEWGITPKDLKKTIAAVKNSGAEVLPVGQALEKLEKN